MINKDNDKKTPTKAHKRTFDKWLMVVVTFLLTICFIAASVSGALSIGDAIGFLFAIWLCIGAWHGFDDYENEREFGFWTILTWVLRYSNKKGA